MAAKGIPLVGLEADIPDPGTVPENESYVQIDGTSGVYQSNGVDTWTKTLDLVDIPTSSLLATVGPSSPGGFYDAITCGAAGNGTTDDTAIIQQMIDWAFAIQGGIVWLTPGRTFKVTGLILRTNVWIMGDMRGSTLYSTSNAPILRVADFANHGGVAGLTIRGSVTAGGSQIGLKLDGTEDYYGFKVRDVSIEDCGDHGLYIGQYPFSPDINNVHVTNCADYPFLVYAPYAPCITLKNCYAHAIRSGAVVGFRIKAGRVVLDNCNGIDTAIAGSKWAVIGRKNGVDGDAVNAGAKVIFRDCNIESFFSHGIHAYSDSAISLLGRTGIAGGNPGSQKAIEWEHINDGSDYYAQFLMRGTIDDTVDIADGVSAYTNSEPFHANGFFPLQIQGQGPYAGGSSNPRVTTYRNSVTSASMKMARADSNLSKVSMTDTLSITQPGVTYIEVNISAAKTLEIYWGGWGQNAQSPLIIKDIAGNLATNNLTVTVNSGGTINGASSFVMNRNRQCLILVPDGNTGGGDWRIEGNYADNEATVATSTALALTAFHKVVLVTTGGSDKAITLPAASTALIGRTYFIYKVDNAAGGASITPSGTNLINGSNSARNLTTFRGCVMARCVAANEWLTHAWTVF